MKRHCTCDASIYYKYCVGPATQKETRMACTLPPLSPDDEAFFEEKGDRYVIKLGKFVTNMRALQLWWIRNAKKGTAKSKRKAKDFSKNFMAASVMLFEDWGEEVALRAISVLEKDRKFMQENPRATFEHKPQWVLLG